MTTRKAIVENGNTADGVKEGLAAAYQQATNFDTNILLITPVKDQLKHGILVDALGEDVCKNLLSGKKLGVGDGKTTLEHATKRTFSGYGRTEEVVLACWLDGKAMDAVDGTEPPAVIYVAWHPDDGTAWAKQWGLEEESGSGEGLDPVVKRALKSLTGKVNRSTGLRHPKDKKAAKDTFLILTRAGYTLTSDQVHAYALEHGWQPADARDLGELAEAIAGGKYGREGVETWREDILEIWEEPS